MMREASTDEKTKMFILQKPITEASCLICVDHSCALACESLSVERDDKSQLPQLSRPKLTTLDQWPEQALDKLYNAVDVQSFATSAPRQWRTDI